MSDSAQGPCEHGNRWRQGLSCRACWEYAEGKHDERERIVAWLRSMKHGSHVHHRENLANMIEQGAHR